MAPAYLPSFPKKNYLQNLRKIDFQAIEIRRLELESYLGHVLNDPAYLCQELLDFVECKLSIDTVLKSKNYEYSYILCTPIMWDNEVGKDSHYIIYTLTFTKMLKNKKVDEWTVKRRYKDFDRLHNFILKRSTSPMLSNYLNVRSTLRHSRNSESLPSMPGKTLTPISSPQEIDVRRRGLEEYLERLLAIPSVIDSYEFKSFISDNDL